jgi:glycosyltransferase involved in cell wall biosynthesis
MGLPRVSFVVPAHNEELLLPRTLDAIRSAATALALDIEIIVADDASTDGTAGAALARGARVVPAGERRIASTRNAGARAATGELIVFVDADSVVHADLVRAAVEHARAGGVAGGSRCAFDGTIPLWARLVERPAMALYRFARLTPGAFLFCTREAFDAVGGFDEGVFGGEEVLMARALDRYARKRGRRFTILPHAVVTSGRKLRAYSGGELMWTLARLLVRGRRGARRREGFELWYGDRRRDPQGVPDVPHPPA